MVTTTDVVRTQSRRKMARSGSSGDLRKGGGATGGGGGSGGTDGADAAAAAPGKGRQPRKPSPAGGVGPLRRLRKRIRSRSAPASLRRRRPLIEDHYRVDPEERVVLPGVPKQDDDNLARDVHDFFNLIVLVPVVVLNGMNWNWDVLWLALGGGGGGTDTMADAWTGEWFEPFFAVTALYFTVDLVWVAAVPRCVKSPGTIVQHHVATLLYILIPRYWPPYRWIMGACMSVEVNTWFLIARRVFNKQGLPPWVIDLPPFISVRVKLISVCFYASWLTIRCGIYPLIWTLLWDMYLDLCRGLGTRVNVLLVAVTLHSVFCALNFKWTYDLLMSKIRYWRKGGRYKVDKGL